jgi:hypothetical protein
MVIGLGMLGLLSGTVASTMPLAAQAPAATAMLTQRGTVKTVSGSTITMATDAGQAYTVTVPEGARILQVPVGSVDLKSATQIQLTDIAEGDHVLITGKAGSDAGTLNAVRVILMKSGDIAQKNAAEQADWKARGTGGIVSGIDPASGDITITSGTKKIVIQTSSKTEFRRFAGDSVQYQDARMGTLADIHVKDQLQARGAKSADGTSMAAEEVVSGSFQNLSGLIASVDPAGTITLKDLATKKMMTVNVTTKSDLRKMPLQMATNFAARSNGGQGGGRRSGGGQDATAGGGGGDAGSMRRAAGADLSQMIARLPTITAADLHKGDAVMIVASETVPGASTVTAITVLTGVDPILTANPNGGMDLSMNMGGGGTGGGGPE